MRVAWCMVCPSFLDEPSDCARKLSLMLGPMTIDTTRHECLPLQEEKEYRVVDRLSESCLIAS